MVTVHITARMLPWRLSLLDAAPWFWEWLKESFPGALAVCLMPRHLHIIDEVDDPAAAVVRLRRLLTWHARLHVGDELARVWAPVRGAPLRGREEVWRQVRFVALNPCSAGYTSDPLEWPWSTHRDVMGAVAEPWIQPDRLAAALGEPSRGFAAAHHAYVSCDRDADVAATPLPLRCDVEACAPPLLSDIALAALRATRSELEALSRRGRARQLFLTLAYSCGWTDPRDLARACDMSRRGVRSALERGVPGRWMSAAELCLGDLRLLRGPSAPRAHEVRTDAF